MISRMKLDGPAAAASGSCAWVSGKSDFDVFIDSFQAANAREYTRNERQSVLFAFIRGLTFQLPGQSFSGWRPGRARPAFRTAAGRSCGRIPPHESAETSGRL